MKNISVARYMKDFSAIIRTQRRLCGNGYSYSFPMLSEQHTNEWSEILSEVGTRYFFFGPLAAIPLFKNLSPLSAIPLVFQKFPIRYR